MPLFRSGFAGCFAVLYCTAILWSAEQPFSIVVLPDTQAYVASDELNLGFEAQTTWIQENAAEKNIKFVTQIGDIVSNGGGGLIGNQNQPEWDRANRAMSTLDTPSADYPFGIPWGTAVGNHELDTVDVVGSGFSRWKAHFGAATTGRFAGKPWFGGTSPDDLNTYQYFSANGRDYLMLHLEFDVPDASIAWAKEVLAAHPGRPTILSTHVYEGTAHGPPHAPYLGGPGRNSQLQIFDKLIDDNPQIFLVVSGHTGEEKYRVRQNAAGLDVIQVVQDYSGRPNGGDGWLRIFEFDEQASEVRARTFTPGVPAHLEPRYEVDCNSHFTIPLDWGVRFDGEPAPAPNPDDKLQLGTRLIDEFTVAQTEHYALSQSYNSGGTFQILDGALRVRPGYNNTVAVMLDDGEHFLKPGHRVAVDILDEGNSFVQISTIPAQPDGSNSFGFRVRRDGDFRIQTYTNNGTSIGEFRCDPGGPVTIWVDRLTATEFEFYYERGGERTLIERATLPEAAEIEDLFFGVQVFEVSGGGGVRFDNLRIGAVPEPTTRSSLLLVIFVLLRRKPRWN